MEKSPENPGDSEGDVEVRTRSGTRRKISPVETPPEAIASINRHVEELLAQYDKNQSALARHLGVNPRTVSKWAAGIKDPEVGLLMTLARELKKTTDEILGLHKPTGPSAAELRALREADEFKRAIVQAKQTLERVCGPSLRRRKK